MSKILDDIFNKMSVKLEGLIDDVTSLTTNCSLLQQSFILCELHACSYYCEEFTGTHVNNI